MDCNTINICRDNQKQSLSPGWISRNRTNGQKWKGQNSTKTGTKQSHNFLMREKNIKVVCILKNYNKLQMGKKPVCISLEETTNIKQHGHLVQIYTGIHKKILS